MNGSKTAKDLIPASLVGGSRRHNECGYITFYPELAWTKSKGPALQAVAGPVSMWDAVSFIGGSLGFVRCDKTGKQPAAVSFAAGQKLFVTRWCLADSFATPAPFGKASEIQALGFPLPLFCAPLTSARNIICR